VAVVGFAPQGDFFGVGHQTAIASWPDHSSIALARDEPQFVLGLSFLAITITAADVWATTDVRTEQEQQS